MNERVVAYIDGFNLYFGLNDFRIYYGHYQATPQRCRKCGHQNLFDIAVVISADSDLSAPVIAIKNLFPEKRVIAAFPPQRHSAQLKRLAHGFLQIGRGSIARSMFPDTIQKTDGFVLQRPSEWV